MARLAVIGGGWAGLAAAVMATRRGHEVTLYEMSRQLGGRARSLMGETPEQAALDNGQHILIGAYTATLALMRQVGVDVERDFWRGPLALVDPAGRGLRLPGGPAVPAFARAVLTMKTWPWRERLGLLAIAGGWVARGFRCPPALTVAELCRGLGPGVRHDLIDPLCVSALNTPADRASAAVFLRVLRDALFSGPGAADLMLPRRPLGALLPEPAGQWLRRRGAQLRLGQRVQALERTALAATDRDSQALWRVDGEPFDRVVLAATAPEAARLVSQTAPAWSAHAAAFEYEPIVTVYLRAPGTHLAAPMTALPTDAPEREPAQFAFDHGEISARPGLYAFVISGASYWAARGVDATAQAVRAQAVGALRAAAGAPPPSLQGIEVLKTVAERRATFACTPGLRRPPTAIAEGLAAAGDFVEGPYPATLEGAVRSAALALRTLAV
jgi:hydroxysqualene dehydroxylase